MCEAQLCPVCNGTGHTWYSDPMTSSVGYYTICHACGGTGYIIVPCCCYCPKTCPSCYPHNRSEWWYSSGNTTVKISIIESDEEPPEVI